MKKNELLEFIENYSAINQIELSEIPNINLYMDQVLSFLDEKLYNYKRKDNDKIYTKSMINNYTKNKLLPKPHNKKYTPNHIITLLFVFYMKQVLPLDDINKVLDFSLEKDQAESKAKQLYEVFLKIEKIELNDFNEEVLEIAKKISAVTSNTSEKDDIFKLIMILISKSSAYKLLAEKLIDETFKE